MEVDGPVSDASRSAKRKAPGSDVAYNPSDTKGRRIKEDAGGAKVEEDATGADKDGDVDMGIGMDLGTALNFYYAHFFPYDEMYEWLSYGDAKYFYHREFSFTVDETYIRYQTFRSQGELKKKLRSMQPHKIDIGAVYTLPAVQHNSVKKEVFHTEERELVFDIDLTDYDDVRTCCGAAKICKRCFRLMKVAVKVIDTALRQDFAFKDLLWVFSGRRGIHCWVCDKRARALSDPQRTAVVEYLTAIQGGSEKTGVKVAVTTPLLPSMERAFKELEMEFVTSVITRRDGDKGTGLLEEPSQWDKALARLPNYNDLPRRLSKRFGERDFSALQRWKMLKASVDTAIEGISKKRNPGRDELLMRSLLRKAVADIVFAYVYPRLDADVSKHQNHLLKSPFCVHPKTGNVCVPMDPKRIDEFDPTKVPTVYELAAAFSRHGDVSKALGARKRKGNMLDTLLYFRNEFLKPMAADREAEAASAARRSKIQAREEAERNAAATSDW